MADTAWKQFERRCAKMLGGTRSGPVGKDGPDVAGIDLAVQCKRTASTTGGIRGDWIRQARRDSKKAGKPFVLVVGGHNDRAPVAVVDFYWLAQLIVRAGA